jgi:hypothetical protein
MDKFLEMFKEECGAVSSMRILMLAYGVGVLIVWVVLSIKNGNILDIPTSIQTILGILVTGKVIQKPLEQKACDTTEVKKG